MLVLYWLPFGQSLEREYGLPLLYTMRGPLPVPGQALIVGLDNQSVQWLNRHVRRIDEVSPRLGACLPQRAREDLVGAANINHIPRAVHACLLDVLVERQARVIVFDINFNRERPDDDLFAAAIARAGNVLLFERVSDTREAIVERRRPLQAFEDAAMGTHAFHVDSARGEIATGYVTSFAPFDDLMPMPEKAWAAFTGQAPSRGQVDVQPIWLYGPPQSVPTIPLRAVFDPSMSRVLPRNLSDRVVFIGSSDPTDAAIDDHFPVPTSGRGNTLIGGVELAATAFLNRLNGTMLSRPDTSVESAIVFGIALVGGLAVLSLTRWRLLLTIAACSVGYLLLASVLFSDALIWLPIAVPVFMTTVIVSLAALSVRYLFARSLVARLAPRQIASVLLEGTVADRRDARSEEATILFSDLVGSTGLAEGMDELDYTAAVNLYYDTATSVIEAHDGMVVEFMGDGIHAMFSESVTGPSHAVRACEAARALALRLGTASAKGDVPLRLRIGVNSGLTAIGDVGARHRFNFKALGDVVNVAARLEQIGKEIMTDEDAHIILISEATRSRAGLKPSDLQSIGTRTVRGRLEALEIHRLRG